MKSLDEETVNRINEKFVRSTDKFHRMFRGVGTELLNYVDGCLYIRIHAGEGNTEGSRVLADKSSANLRDWIPELKDAKEYHAQIRYMKKPADIAMNMPDPKNQNAMEAMAMAMADVLLAKPELVREVIEDGPVPPPKEA
jgi:hypothetical protein